MTTREMATQLAGLGWPLVPCCAPRAGDDVCTATWHGRPCDRVGKRPLLRGYPGLVDEPLTSKELEREACRLSAVNLALVTGGLLCAVEGDSLEAETEITELCCGHPVTPTRERRPGRGRAYIFSIPAGVDIVNRAHLGRSGAIDIRGRGGILVLPPSVHVTGHGYDWVPDRAPLEVAPAPIPVALLPLVVAAPRRPTRSALGDVPEQTTEPGVSSRVAFLLKAHRRLAELWAGRGKTVGDRSRSGYDHAVARELVRRRVPVKEVVGALAARPGAHRRDPAYLHETVAAAIAAHGRAS